jgi:DNA (cytosine-5)-methyltransferase 1
MDLRTAVAEIPLLPTPAVNDMGAAYTPETWDEWTATMKAKHNNGNGHGKSLNVEAQRLLPTPEAADASGGRKSVELGGTRPSGAKRAITLATAVDHLLPTPQARDEKGYGPADLDRKDPNLSALPMLLPTPMANEAEKAIQGPRLSDGQKYLSNVVHELLPTPRATDGTKGGPNQRGSSGDLMLPSAVNLLPTPRTVDTSGIKTSPRARELYSSGDSMGDIVEQSSWGEYEPAIRRWEAMTRPAPEPTKLNAKGNPKLSDEFDEWLMGLPAGWITEVPGVTWNEVLKACGNGVVWQQAVAALVWLVGMQEFAA